MSNVRRLRLTDRIFFVCVNLRPRIKSFHESEYALLIPVLKESRPRLGFQLCGYVLMPDPRHALIYPQYPLLLWQVLHDAKKLMTLRLHARRGRRGPFWQHQFWDRFVRNEREFHQRLEYMHLNPVRKGRVKRPEDWKWSRKAHGQKSTDRGYLLRDFRPRSSRLAASECSPPPWGRRIYYRPSTPAQDFRLALTLLSRCGSTLLQKGPRFEQRTITSASQHRWRQRLQDISDWLPFLRRPTFTCRWPALPWQGLKD